MGSEDQLVLAIAEYDSNNHRVDIYDLEVKNTPGYEDEKEDDEEDE